MIKVEELRGVPVLTALDELQLERTAVKARRLHFSEGESLFSQGDIALRFFYVHRGQIKLTRVAADGNEKVIEVVSAGQTFAEALMFRDHPTYPVSARSVYAAEVFSLDARDFRHMLKKSTETCLVLLGDMSTRLHRLIREIDDLTLHSGTCRVASYLLSELPGDLDAYDLPLPKGVLASRLSVKPETFSRIIKQLSERGIIAVNGHHVTVHSRKELAALGTADIPV